MDQEAFCIGKVRDQRSVTWSSKKYSHTTKFAGSMRRSEHVPGHPDVAYEFPAQSPKGCIDSAREKAEFKAYTNHKK